MRRHTLTLMLAAGLLLLAGPGAAELVDFGQTAANGCEVFVGQGAGQVLTPFGQYPMIDRGTIHLRSLEGDREYNFEFEATSFPPVPTGVGAAFAQSGFAAWRFVENGVRGTNRYRIVATPNDPVAPTAFDLLLEGEVLQSNRYSAGGSFLSGRLDAATGGYTIDYFSIVLCQP